MTINIQLDAGAFMPEYAHVDDAGMDLRAPKAITVPARGSAVVDTGVHVEIPRGYKGEVKSKSGLNVRDGITSEGVIDAGYTGAIVVKLYNHTDAPRAFERGDKISQLIVTSVEHAQLKQVAQISGGPRGNGGFGSTGR